ncbi:WD repeat-containing protein 78 [Larimichthys crocea]|uniref:Dynein axonemal intermediate chain 4 n=1 Tax=Larimichthys crocea TaxID=215358 RepID=A0A6G0HCP2_LARCR|nr:WD repeat-containing protein 78 isoform X2 [Larimichthys crocea]KAE8276934.1 WD repeat-containing protein 78 [Larimichthys crocea]
MKSSQAGAQSASQTLRWSFTDSQTQIKSILSGSMSSLDSVDRSTDEAPRRNVTILDRGRDVTPLSLHQAEPGCFQSGPERLFLDELFSSSGSEHSSGLSSGSLVGSSQGSTLSLNKESEDNIPQMDRPINLTAPRGYHLELSLPPPVVPKQEDDLKQPVTEKMLNEEVDICLTETHIISLFEQPNTFVSEDADDAEAQKERNSQYAELCKNRIGSLKYVERAMLTINEATKDKQTQSDTIATVDKGTYATIWDIYDSFCDQSENPGSVVNTSRDQETSGEERNISSTLYAEGSTIEICRNNSNTELDPQLIMMSESFQHSLLLMERIIVGNIFQPQLAAYRQLPILEDPDRTETPKTETRSKECDESSSSPALKHFWAFSFELTRKCIVTCMTWNKEDPNILAVGYSDTSDQKRGLICCWSLKNLKWPERVFHCDSCVTSMDFSAINPGQLAVGMSDSTVAIYNVHFRNNRPRIGNSGECTTKSRQPVWQVQWTKPEMSSLRKTMVESLISVSADGWITEWSLCSSGLDGRDLMQLKRSINFKQTTEAMKKKKILLSTLTPGHCIDFHPVESTNYLVGTDEGHIHKCSLFNDQYFLDTYKAHVCPVNHVEWSPFSGNVFLSCSSDSYIQLWSQDHYTPVMTFATTQKVVLAVRWSLKQSTVFAAIYGQQVEIWDLNQNIVKPIIMHHAAPGVRLTCLLFATDSDCVFVGDHDGQVTVYELKNLSVGAGKKVDTLDDIVHYELSRQLKARM